VYKYLNNFTNSKKTCIYVTYLIQKYNNGYLIFCWEMESNPHCGGVVVVVVIWIKKVWEGLVVPHAPVFKLQPLSE
jgi:hypothetical protein